MARKQKTKIDPEVQRLLDRARDLEAVSLQPEAARLKRQQDIQITRSGDKRDDRKVEGDQARRLDAFAAIKSTLPAGAFDAARRLETDILTRRGENDKAPATGRIDRTAGLTTDAMIDAARMVEAVESRLAPRDWWLLNELICPPIDRGTWRDHVSYITGEKHTEGQAAAVRAVSTNLRDAYAAADREIADRKRRAA